MKKTHRPGWLSVSVASKRSWKGWRRPLLGGISLLPLACGPEDTPAPLDEVMEMPEDEDEDIVVALTPCEMVYGDACEAPCDAATACENGLYCKGGICVVDCFTDAECSEGMCTGEGRCAKSNIIVMPTETDPTPEEEERPTCVEGQVEFEPVLPQVWLLLDRSSSMNSSMGDQTRWEALGSVLLGDPEDSTDRGVVGDFEDRVAFGATFYTNGSGSRGCALNLESVALAVNSYDSIRQRYNKLGPTGGTPTADSVAAVVAQASDRDLTGGPKLLVLATDGSPGACRTRTEQADVAVEDEVSQAFLQDIETFAIRISTGAAAEHMQRVANLGVGLPADADPPAPYFTAESQDELKMAFSTIIEDVPRSCVFTLNGEVELDEAGEGTVVLSGRELAYQDPDGWLLKQADQVELVGAACDQVQAGEEDLDINFPCSVFSPTEIR